MEFAEVKTNFLKNFVVGGYTSLKDVPSSLIECIPATLIEKWLSQFQNAPLITEIPKSPRLVNHFTLGADPEFTFQQQGVNIPAMKLGLQTGLAFGMDMNGRLAELRPMPSRFVLDIIASILIELRWMATLNPLTTDYSWVATPFDGQDGVGGHIHLARKRDNDTRREEIKMLELVYHALTDIGTFNRDLIALRRNNTRYGQAQDYRLQKHGYEYRAIPTWLDSPWLAYFVLTITKLAMFDSNLFKSLWDTNRRDTRKLEQSLINLISYYKNIDDDAWITFHALKLYGIPKQVGMDFRPNWGIVYPKVNNKKDNRYFPSMIEPTNSEREAIFQYLTHKAPIKPERPICNWEPNDIPEDYNWMMNYSQTYHKVGIGEIITDLVTHKDLPVIILADEDKNRITTYIPPNLNCQQGVMALLNLAPNITNQCMLKDDGQIQIYLPAILRTSDYIPLVKRVLTSGLFPIWTVHNVKEGCFDEWTKKQGVKSVTKLVGKELS